MQKNEILIYKNLGNLLNVSVTKTERGGGFISSLCIGSVQLNILLGNFCKTKKHKWLYF